MSALLLINCAVVFLLVVGIYAKNAVICKSKKRLDGRTVVVTGGTAGMGLEIAKDLAQRGARVIVACPYPDEGATALQDIKQTSDSHNVLFKLLDLASLQSTRNFASEILDTEDRLDILINNAGIAGPTTAATRDGLDLVMQVNYFGPFLLTVLLLPLLKKSGCPEDPSRIVNVSSVMHWFGTTAKSTRWPPTSYSNSKLFLVLFSRELTKRLKDFNVVVNNADPGVVGTKISNTISTVFGKILTVVFYIFAKNPWQGAQNALHVALDEKAGKVSGEYFKNCELVRAKHRAYDDELATKSWKESVQLVKLTDEELGLSLGS